MSVFAPFVGQSYTAYSPVAAASQTFNLYPEAIESGDGQNTAYLRATPGLTLDQTIATSPCRGIWIGASRLFAVFGSKLVEVFSNQTNSVLGDVGDDAAHSPAQIFPNGTQLLIIATGQAWVADGITVTPALYPNRFGQISTIGTAVTWISGAKFDATMVGITMFINTVPYVVSAYVDATHVTLSESAGTSVGSAYNMALAVTGTVTPDGTTTVPWTSGAKFDAGMVGETIAINGVNYTIAAFTDDQHIVTTVAVPAHAAIAYSITSPVFASCGACLDGYGIVAKPSTRQINISAINDFKTWNLLDFAFKQGYPDSINQLLADHEELVIFGEQTSEVWRNTGAVFPFERDPGAFIPIGAIQWTPCRLGNGVAFLGLDTRGGAVAYRATGYIPTRVSTHAEEALWATFSTTTDAQSYTYTEEGHEFWVITFPTANVTRVYDATSGVWHGRGWWNGATNDRQRGAFHGYVFGKHYLGDWQNGKLYTASASVYNDAGALIQRIRAAPHLSTEHLWSFYSRFELLMECGVGAAGTVNTAGTTTVTWASGTKFEPGLVGTTITIAGVTYTVASYTDSTHLVTSVLVPTATGAAYASNPVVTLDWSDDGGHTFGTAHTALFGAALAYATRVIWRRLGKSRDRVFRVTITAGVKIALVNAYLDVEAGSS